ncbi:uncharacterized protein LOC126778495 isoform X1 [Nymphalis io]|uniref:uncharacterized protein LOC126778495 isoform X1 n=1 Tax=Inachis io TaxID=171585 RepID=UPI002169ED28|nr:uncharacterized protein LOC126778495 isoform X1 [Nymphalis io]
MQVYYLKQTSYVVRFNFTYTNITVIIKKMNKTTIILNLIISILSVVKANNETNTSKDSNELSEKIVETVTIENSYVKDSSNVVNKYDFLGTTKMIGKNNPRKTFFVKIRRLKEPEMENDKTMKTSPISYFMTSEKPIKVTINPHEEESSEKLSNNTEISHDANEWIKTKVTSKVSETKDKEEENTENPLKVDIKLESVTNKSVIDEDPKRIDFEIEKPNDELSSDGEEVLDDIEFTRRMMTAQYWKKDENEQDEEEEELIWDKDNNVLLDIKARLGGGDKGNVEHVVIANADMKPESRVITPAISNIDGDNMNNPAIILHPNLHPAVIQRECLQNPALFNIRHDKPLDLNERSSYENINLGNTHHIPPTRNNYFHPQLPLLGAQEPVEFMLPQIDDFNSQLFSNAYAYTPPLSRTTLDEPTVITGSALLSKLFDASEHLKIGQKFKTNANTYDRMFFNNYDPRNAIRPNYNVFRYLNRFKRCASCCCN